MCCKQNILETEIYQNEGFTYCYKKCKRQQKLCKEENNVNLEIVIFNLLVLFPRANNVQISRQ